MSNSRIHVPQVGAPDPELTTSMIAEEFDEEYEVARQEEPGNPVCYFNQQTYTHDQFVCSGSTRLRCTYGIWVRNGSCDPDNP